MKESTKQVRTEMWEDKVMGLRSEFKLKNLGL